MQRGVTTALAENKVAARDAKGEKIEGALLTAVVKKGSVRKPKYEEKKRVVKKKKEKGGAGTGDASEGKGGAGTGGASEGEPATGGKETEDGGGKAPAKNDDKAAGAGAGTGTDKPAAETGAGALVGADAVQAPTEPPCEPALFPTDAASLQCARAPCSVAGFTSLDMQIMTGREGGEGRCPETRVAGAVNLRRLVGSCSELTKRDGALASALKGALAAEVTAAVDAWTWMRAARELKFGGSREADVATRVPVDRTLVGAVEPAGDGATPQTPGGTPLLHVAPAGSAGCVLGDFSPWCPAEYAGQDAAGRHVDLTSIK